jgi:hypothetical protein
MGSYPVLVGRRAGSSGGEALPELLAGRHLCPRRRAARPRPRRSRGPARPDLLGDVTAVSLRVAFQLRHPLGQPTLALTEADFGELADRGTAGAAVLAGVCVDTREQIVGQRDHHLRHTQSIPVLPGGGKPCAPPEAEAGASGRSSDQQERSYCTQIGCKTPILVS